MWRLGTLGSRTTVFCEAASGPVAVGSGVFAYQLSRGHAPGIRQHHGETQVEREDSVVIRITISIL